MMSAVVCVVLWVTLVVQCCPSPQPRMTAVLSSVSRPLYKQYSNQGPGLTWVACKEAYTHANAPSKDDSGSSGGQGLLQGLPAGDIGGLWLTRKAAHAHAAPAAACRQHNGSHLTHIRMMLFVACCIGCAARV